MSLNYLIKIKGFTLLEVMVALVIVVIAFTAFYSSVNSIAKNQNIIIEKSHAVWVSDNVFAQLNMGIVDKPISLKPIQSSMQMGRLTFDYRLIPEVTTDKDTLKYVLEVFNKDGIKIHTAEGFGNI